MSTLEVLEKLTIPSMTPVEGQEYEGEVSLPSAPGLRASVPGKQGLSEGDHLEVVWITKAGTETVFTHEITEIEEVNPVHFYVKETFITPGLVTTFYEVVRDDRIWRSKPLIIMVK
ncbi:hypothetical protein [Pseudomonas sp. ANT_J28]|uniref:hypothetical protein n=1 Tax=Pseudomonas sp. ANT_J28 TaxID=2597352 RepID=UPI0011F0A9A7|nr:hypothetical protein [Pseudomonas sp. ANT_J28]KAA0975138.1 hypothetical protein FQ187_28465 [Pseudomonas sp. ANT_J28]